MFWTDGEENPLRSDTASVCFIQYSWLYLPIRAYPLPKKVIVQFKHGHSIPVGTSSAQTLSSYPAHLLFFPSPYNDACCPVVTIREC